MEESFDIYNSTATATEQRKSRIAMPQFVILRFSDFPGADTNLFQFIRQLKDIPITSKSESHMFFKKATSLNETYRQLQKRRDVYLVNQICDAYFGIEFEPNVLQDEVWMNLDEHR